MPTASGAEFVATGHYARMRRRQSARLASACSAAVDTSKDQSYVLFGIEREYLPRMLLPVGGLSTRPRFGAWPRELGLAVADKTRQPGDLLRARAAITPSSSAASGPAARLPGEVVMTTGDVVGTHDGLERFTIGQPQGAWASPWASRGSSFAWKAETNRVVLGTQARV